MSFLPPRMAEVPGLLMTVDVNGGAWNASASVALRHLIGFRPISAYSSGMDAQRRSVTRILSSASSCVVDTTFALYESFVIEFSPISIEIVNDRPVCLDLFVIRSVALSFRNLI